jgi:hypothetical protein
VLDSAKDQPFGGTAFAGRAGFQALIERRGNVDSGPHKIFRLRLGLLECVIDVDPHLKKKEPSRPTFQVTLSGIDSRRTPPPPSSISPKDKGENQSEVIREVAPEVDPRLSVACRIVVPVRREQFKRKPTGGHKKSHTNAPFGDLRKQ